MIYEIIVIVLLIWTLTRGDYNQWSISVGDIRASDEGARWSGDQDIRLGGGEG